MSQKQACDIWYTGVLTDEIKLRVEMYDIEHHKIKDGAGIS